MSPTRPNWAKQVTVKTLTYIRKIAIAKANTLQSCHLHIESLGGAFNEWANGEIYVCKKTGTYRYRFGARSKGVTDWDHVAREAFKTPEAFAFAAMVFAEPKPAIDSTPAPQIKALPKPETRRANVIALATQDAA